MGKYLQFRSLGRLCRWSLLRQKSAVLKVLSLAACMVLLACGANSPLPNTGLEPIEVGKAGGACYGNGTCNEGLECDDWVCVDEGGDDAELQEDETADAGGDVGTDSDVDGDVQGTEGRASGDVETDSGEGVEVEAGDTAEVEAGPVCGCEGKECGDDGCGASCGTCAAGWQECVAGQCAVIPAPVDWRPVAGGTFNMGCSPGDTFCKEDEFPVHEVKLTSFEMMASEVTVWQWLEVYGELPECAGQDDGLDHPVGCMEWVDAKFFCEAVGGRLPTEAEWEYAARGKTTTRFYCGDDPDCLDDIAWGEWSEGYGLEWVGLKEVMGKVPNVYGLYDMFGNVREWTGDYYAKYPSAYQENPSVSQGTNRVSRGGSLVEGVLGMTGVKTMSVSTRLPLPTLGVEYPGEYPAANVYQGFRCVRDN